MKLFLIHENGEKQEFNIGDSVTRLLRAIQRNDIETIIAGELKNGKVLWEKQFNACTVMPSDFGKREQP